MGERVGVDKYGTQSGLYGSEHRCYISIGRNNYAVALVEPAEFLPCQKNETQGIETVAYANTEMCSDHFGHLPFKRDYRFSAYVTSRVDYVDSCIVQSGYIALIDCGKVEKRIFYFIHGGVTKGSGGIHVGNRLR